MFDVISHFNLTVTASAGFDFRFALILKSGIC